MLEVKGISKFYGNKMAVQDISFSVSQGQVVGLLGHNGCGKSTTMNIITNCLAPSDGEVFIDGISVAENPITAKTKIGYLPEIPPVYPDMTVEEQLKFTCGLRKVPKKEYETQIRTVCEYLNITGVRKRLIHNLSKGYRQRVGFAQALIGNPQLLILDEPTVGLDPQQIIELRELILRLKEKHTIIISSHILSEIAVTCDRILVLSNGRLVADDTLSGLVRRASEGAEVVLQADGTPVQITELVQSIDAVEECRTETDPITGEPEYHICVKDGEDIHSELFSRLAEAGWPIRVLKPVHASLEDVFLRLTQDRRYLTKEVQGQQNPEGQKQGEQSQDKRIQKQKGQVKA